MYIFQSLPVCNLQQARLTIQSFRYYSARSPSCLAHESRIEYNVFARRLNLIVDLTKRLIFL